jgi:hypothetical protein
MAICDAPHMLSLIVPVQVLSAARMLLNSAAKQQSNATNAKSALIGVHLV